MSSPQALLVRTFTDRAEGLSHFVLRAGEAPRLLAFDDALGCPVETALAALEWTGAVGILPDDDLLHAARLTSETAAAVVERKASNGRRFVYLGPRLDAPPMDLFEGAILFDEPGVKAVEFSHRAHALAHFLRATAGAGALLAMLGRRAPELRHLRRWLGPIIQELDGPRPLVAGNRGEAEEVLRQVRRRGITVPIVGGDGLEGIEAAGTLAEGVYLTSAYFPTIPTGANRRFVEAYRRKYPGAGMPNQPAAATYDAIYLLSQVMARAGTDRQSVRRALAGVGSETPPFEGVTGVVAFDAVGDVPAQNVYIGKVHAGAVEVANGSTAMAQGPQP